MAAARFTDYYKPMLATLADEAFDHKDWIFELKLDGYRAVAELSKKKVKLYSRNGLSFAERYPAIIAALQKISRDVVLDGEVVLFNENGQPDFQKLQHYDENRQLPLYYYLFDLISIDGKDIRHLPLVERKRMLEKLIPKKGIIRYCDHVEEDGKRFFEAVSKKNMEGIIAKRADSVYVLGQRTKDWLKIKHLQSREAIIAGYTAPRGGRKHFGALILAQYNDNKLTYMGHTGTGFNESTLKELWHKMQPLVTKDSPFGKKIKVNSPVTWLKPLLVCQVHFTEETEGGMLRHPVYLGLRVDKTHREVQQKNETPQHMSLSSSGDENRKVGGRTVTLTNLSKIYWPEEKITKGEMINFYEKMAPFILPYLKNRPMSLKRNPNGITDAGFYHKDAGGSAPSWVNKKKIFSEGADKEINYILCNDAASLLYIANLGCIEMNPWNSTIKKQDYPDYMVIDLDPADGNTFEQVIETAIVVKDVLDSCGAAAFCKTSGASGLHIYIPMGAKYDYDTVKDFGHLVAGRVQEQLPEFTSLVRSLKKRGNNIYIDYLQNRKGQTLASAYSLRPKKGATVSTPLEWKEVKKGLHPSQFDMFNIFKRLEKKGDLFSAVLGKGIDLVKCRKKLDM